MAFISYETIEELGRVLEEMDSTLQGCLPRHEHVVAHSRPEFISHRLGRPLGHVEGYRGSYCTDPKTYLDRRFLSRNVGHCMDTIEIELTKAFDGDREFATKIGCPMGEWFELAMRDLGVDYGTLE